MTKDFRSRKKIGYNRFFLRDHEPSASVVEIVVDINLANPAGRPAARLPARPPGAPFFPAVVSQRRTAERQTR